MSDNNPHKGHRQRLRARYLKEGSLESFDDHLILELLLFYSIPRADTNELAHKLLNEYKTAANLISADPRDIIKRCKVNEQTAVLISLIPHLSRWYLSKQTQSATLLDSAEKAGEFALGLLTGFRNEAFYCICLNIKNKVLSSEQITGGTVSQAYINPRSIAECAIKYNAAGVIIAHNHPSGDLTPSKSDIDTTSRIKQALTLIDIRLLDHIITGGGRYYSFAENGMI